MFLTGCHYHHHQKINYLYVMHPKDNEVYPIGTVVRIKKTGVFAIIRKHGFLKDGKNFLHYLGEIEGKEGLFALYHDDIEVEVI
jgi:hypothetical protein